jgi:hypothetical protein
MSVELFRYRGAARDGRTLEYVFEAGEQNSPNAVTKEKAAEFAADFMTTFEKMVILGLRESKPFAIRAALSQPELMNLSPAVLPKMPLK